MASSVTELLAGFARDLEAGRYQLDADALEDGNEFLVADATIDLLNWRQAERWLPRSGTSLP